MKVYELLSDESKWCREAMARDRQGVPIAPEHPTACAWCLDAAIKICYPSPDEASRVRQRVRAVTQVDYVQHFNDAPQRTFAEVLGLVVRLDL